MKRRVRERVVGASVEEEADGAGRELIIARWLGSLGGTATGHARVTGRVSRWVSHESNLKFLQG
jgi:hypothetical protein